MAERLGDVVVGAAGEAAHLLELLRPRRQHQHRDVRDVADALERLVAVEPGHGDVEDHERRRRLEQPPQPGAAVGRLVHRVAGAHEHVAQQSADVGVVVDDEQALGVVHTVFIPARDRISP